VALHKKRKEVLE